MSSACQQQGMTRASFFHCPENVAWFEKASLWAADAKRVQHMELRQHVGRQTEQVLFIAANTVSSTSSHGWAAPTIADCSKNESGRCRLVIGFMVFLPKFDSMNSEQ